MRSLEEFLLNLIITTKYLTTLSKKYRCDKCKLYDVKINDDIPITPSEEESYKNHVEEKKLMREEKSEDKNSEYDDMCIVIVDLENVITLPKAESSSFF